jgi:predicted O-methyltransferase YrrM
MGSVNSALTAHEAALLFGIPEDLVARIDDCIAKLEGWCTREKGYDLCRLVLTNNCRTVVEIGVFGGRSMIPMAFAVQYLGTGTVIGIEPFQNTIAVETPTGELNDAWWTRVDFIEPKKTLYRYIAEHNLAGYTKMIELSSDQAVAAFAAGRAEASIDLLHIDGSHATAQALRDVTNWSPLLSASGIVVIDDINWATVQPARQWLADHLRLVDEVATSDGGYAVYRMSGTSSVDATSLRSASFERNVPGSPASQ